MPRGRDYCHTYGSLVKCYCFVLKSSILIVFMIDLLFPLFDRILDASKSSVLDDFFSDSFPYRGKQTKKKQIASTHRVFLSANA